ncbi:acetylornithine deacetylase [Kiloniella majae]|uniref:acetylornithine deacetylase n=1 Tax=Kiloniella majae TaxID=1938558 RepID=UPI000A2778C6|nr:acetylornithine deacetylase [Kiloniella majae]
MAEYYSAKEMLTKLVSFDTVSRNSNIPLIEFVEEYLSSHGVTSKRVPNGDGSKTNLWATIGPDKDGGVILSGHTDVVPVEGQPWDTDPFDVIEADGLLYGRGTADMKAFSAIALSLVPDMIKAKMKRPIHLALSYDEEVGCLGAPSMIEDMAPKVKAEAVIVGEPTMMKVVSGHKGALGLITRVRGFEVHSSLVHTGVSAVLVAAKLVVWHEKQMLENKARTENLPENALFDPPYTSLHCGVIEGGTASNITAKDCSFTTDIRTLPQEDPMRYLDAYRAYAEELEAEMKRVAPSARIEIEVTGNVPGCRREADGSAERLVRQITGDNAEHVVSYGTEAGQFQDGGYSTIVCGPGDIAQAHAANEYLSVEQLNAGVDFQRRLIDRLAS